MILKLNRFKCNIFAHFNTINSFLSLFYKNIKASKLHFFSCQSELKFVNQLIIQRDFDLILITYMFSKVFLAFSIIINLKEFVIQNLIKVEIN